MDIRQELRDFIVRTFFLTGEATLADDDLLLEQGIIDSTGVLEILGFIEERFGIGVDDAEILPENLGSIARITAFVERRGRTVRRLSS